MVFHEITRDAIERALDETREIDAAARRRAGDAPDPRPPLRLRGLAGALEEGHAGALGRSRAVGRDAARRRARARADAFVAAGYWDIDGHVRPRLVRGAARGGRRASASRRAATSPRTARSSRADVARLDEAAARALAAGLDGVAVRGPLRRGEAVPRRPAAPFMTSTLQQEASRKLRFAAQRDARRPGLTRTATSPTCAPTRRRCPSRRSRRRATQARRALRRRLRPGRAAAVRPKVKNAQEAHEAIRPAGDSLPHAAGGRAGADARRARALRPDLEAHARLADGRRARAARSRCASARRRLDGEDAEFGASGTMITFRGFLAAYEEGRDDDADERRRGAPAAARCADGDDVDGDGARAAGPRDHAAGALHRGDRS